MNELWQLILTGSALVVVFLMGMRTQRSINRDDLSDACNDLILTNREDPWTSEEELVTTIDALVEALERS